MIPASGGLITAVNWSMSNMPRFETENVEPVYSLGCSRRVRGRLDDDVVERDLAPALITELLVEGFARLARPLHVYFGCEEEMGNGPERRGEPLRDGLADLGQRNVFVRSAARRGMRDAGCGMRLDDRWSGW